ncbi:hypothetical protein N7530_006782 [Penicillium desertorum]|uniref:Uncharacterized protein n=1 Tax=Penicillium desertorum TaxID=1303715 RepID=A0A9W9WSN8_9EURO|nr:hypothetical protein N7530_006782 [Penicillium desertorum]
MGEIPGSGGLVRDVVVHQSGRGENLGILDLVGVHAVAIRPIRSYTIGFNRKPAWSNPERAHNCRTLNTMVDHRTKREQDGCCHLVSSISDEGIRRNEMQTKGLGHDRRCLICSPNTCPDFLKSAQTRASTPWGKKRSNHYLIPQSESPLVFQTPGDSPFSVAGSAGAPPSSGSQLVNYDS